MNCENKRLIVSFSNGVQISGMMDIDFAKEKSNELYPDKEIIASIMVLDSTSGFPIEIIKREAGQWKQYPIEKTE